MNTRHLWKLTALSLALSTPALAADWRNDGNLKRKKASNAGDMEQAREDGGFALGLRAGYGIAMGRIARSGDGEGTRLGDLVSGAIPLQVDAGYFFNANIYLGAYFQYAPVFLADDCPSRTTCSGSQLRFGANVSYHFRASEKLRPWLGLGIGYELLDTQVSTTLGTTESAIGMGYRGIEFASVQGGADYRINDTLSIGPYVSMTAGVYQTGIARFENVPILGNGETSVDIEDTAVHAWLSGGLRMQLRF